MCKKEQLAYAFMCTCKFKLINTSLEVLMRVCVCVLLCSSENTPEDEDDLYATVYGLEEDYASGEIYEDLMRTEQPTPLVLL